MIIAASEVDLPEPVAPTMRIRPRLSMISSATVEGVHLCCGKCVKAVNAAVSKVAGVTGNTASKDASSFEVTGDFSPKDVFAELNKAGLTGKVAK